MLFIYFLHFTMTHGTITPVLYFQIGFFVLLRKFFKRWKSNTQMK